MSGLNLFATSSTGVYASSDTGATWSNVSTGLAVTNGVNCSVVARDKSGSANLYIGTLNGAWVRPISEMVTGVAPSKQGLPGHFALEQNYPNPFNPSTMISFSLPTKSFVTLKVFDVIGREVTTLASEEKNAGTHQLQWNASSMPSGIYFYRLQAGSFTETKRLIVLK